MGQWWLLAGDGRGKGTRGQLRIRCAVCLGWAIYFLCSPGHFLIWKWGASAASLFTEKWLYALPIKKRTENENDSPRGELEGGQSLWIHREVLRRAGQVLPRLRVCKLTTPITWFCKWSLTGTWIYPFACAWPLAVCMLVGGAGWV